jgi:hypothetical protein
VFTFAAGSALNEELQASQSGADIMRDARQELTAPADPRTKRPATSQAGYRPLIEAPYNMRGNSRASAS